MLDFSSSYLKDWPQRNIFRAQPDVHVCIENTLFIRFLFSFSLPTQKIMTFNARCIFSWAIDTRTTCVSQGNIKFKQIELPVFNTFLTNSNESYFWLYYLLSYTRIAVILSNKLGVTMCLWKRNKKANSGIFMGVHKYMIKWIA